MALAMGDVIAIRNSWRNKGYTFINLLGLAIGIASSIIILLFVFYCHHYG